MITRKYIQTRLLDYRERISEERENIGYFREGEAIDLVLTSEEQEEFKYLQALEDQFNIPLYLS